MNTKDLLKPSFVELLGTFILVFFGTTVAVAVALKLPTDAAYGPALVATTFGLTLACLAASMGHLSGAHVNPAVTLGLAIYKAFPWIGVPFYLIAQVLGAFLASKTVGLVFGSDATTKALLATPVPPTDTLFISVFIMELFITFLLVTVVIATTTDEKAPKSIAPLAIGAALAVGALVGGPISGGSANPARALGPMLAMGAFPNLLAYLIAPLIGGVLAAVVYRFISSSISPKA